MSLSTYYCGIFFLFVGLCIWNANFALTYDKDICYSEKVTPSTSGGDPTTSTVASTGTLTKVPLIITIADAFIAVFILFGLLGIRCFSRMQPEQFGKLGWCMTALGVFVRNFSGIIRITHYLLLLIVIVQFVLIIISSDCRTAIHYSQSGDNLVQKEGEMYSQATLVDLVNIIAWSALHYLLPCIKKFIDEESYLYEARDSDTHILFYIFCQFFGP